MFKFLRKMFSKKTKKGERTMADEKEVKKEVETEKVETKEPEKAEKVEEKKEDETKAVEAEEKKEEKPLEKETEEEKPAEEEQSGEPQVQETEPTGNGIRIEDLVTKEMLAERFASLEAKIDALVKENGDLKSELSATKEKYEGKDFGGFQKQGVMERDSYAEDTFETYSKNFMHS